VPRGSKNGSGASIRMRTRYYTGSTFLSQRMVRAPL
jgi:hypothetical protein